MQKINLEDTIVAISTAAGEGGIGIVRLSGKEALKIADAMFAAKNKMKPSQFKSYTVHYGWIVDKSEEKKSKGKMDSAIVDEALVTVMRAPKSYTAEDVVEISCHGGTIALKTILQLALDLGARPAEPGEFTQRAFLNGRMDLAQAEAVLDIIKSKTDAFLKVSLHQLKGDLTVELTAIREILMNIYTEVEAIVNFPEDDIDAAGRSGILRKIKTAHQRVDKLLRSSEQGKILKEGIKIVICGKPNVGKSSLLNCLLKHPRAIVTDIAGTTRDTIEETAQIKGIPFQLVDTAGILEPRDLVEKEAIKRSRLSIDSADLVLFLLDASRVLTKEDEELAYSLKEKNVLVVVNKCDLPAKLNQGKIKTLVSSKKFLKISVLKKTAIEDLENAIVASVWQGAPVDGHEMLVSNARHINSLKECALSIEKARRDMEAQLSFEFISEEIKLAVSHLDKITGRDIDSDLLDKIFSQFCIGK